MATSSNDTTDREAKTVHRALHDDTTLSMVFQPVVDLRSGRVMGAEALARFKSDPYRTPDLWFAEAWEEEIGVALELKAIQLALATFMATAPPDTYVAVNVAPQTLLAPALVEAISLFPGERIVVELTEHARVDDYDAMNQAIARLRVRGARLSIDDAGAGFSSFQHILALRPDIIKLDRSLTTGVDSNPVRFALASALVTFAGSLGARICAEGIETLPELVALQKLGVAKGQGYFLARPAALPLAAPPTGVWLHPAPSAASPLASPAVRSVERLAALEDAKLMDSDVEDDFDRFTNLAASLLHAPVALISLVDDHRQFFKSALGLSGLAATTRETPLTHSFCQHAVTTRAPLVIDDARAHPLVKDNLAIPDLGVAAYAGVPLITKDDFALGALCVVDPKPRRWTTEEVSTLEELAKMIMVQIEMRDELRNMRREKVVADALFAQTSAPMMLCEISGRIARVNASLCALLGNTPAELEGRTLAELHHPDDAVSDLVGRDELLAGRSDQQATETRYRLSNGQWLDTRVRTSVLRDVDGRACYTLMTVRSTVISQRPLHDETNLNLLPSKTCIPKRTASR